MFAFSELFDDVPEIHIVDIGASPIEGEPVYKPLLHQKGWRLTGFEPHPGQFAALQARTDPRMTFLPYAIGDGRAGELRICASAGMSSLLEPDLELLGHFHGFAEWGKVIERRPMTTRRLDDVEEVRDIDFLKLDVQGGELAVLNGGVEKLKSTLVVFTETLFIPFYKGQPLFGDLDVALRGAGFMFHRFGPLTSRVFRPLMVNNDAYAGMSQVLWSDAAYVRPFTGFGEMAPGALLKVARIVHEVFQSYDLAQLALSHVDRLTGSQRQPRYLERLTRPG